MGWSAVAEINPGFLNKEHLIIFAPKFKYTNLNQDVPVQVLIKSGGKFSKNIKNKKNTISKAEPLAYFLVQFKIKNRRTKNFTSHLKKNMCTRKRLSIRRFLKTLIWNF